MKRRGQDEDGLLGESRISFSRRRPAAFWNTRSAILALIVLAALFVAMLLRGESSALKGPASTVFDASGRPVVDAIVFIVMGELASGAPRGAGHSEVCVPTAASFSNSQ